MPNAIDITAHRFGRITVIKRVGSANGKVLWLCKCKCGNSTKVRSGDLMSGKVKSCGCLSAEKCAYRNTRHGKYGCVEYVTWNNIKNRCYNPNNNRYKDYGGRGITMA